MARKLIPFGIACREHRIRRGLLMSHQARALGCSVSYISLIESGQRPVPANFPLKVAEWLDLDARDAKKLSELGRSLASASATAIDVDVTAFGQLSPDRLRELQEILWSSPKRQPAANG